MGDIFYFYKKYHKFFELKMNYKETLDYMFSRLPMFQREGRPAFKPDLSNSLKLMDMLNQPHQKFKSIHVAGTNGKGSTSHLITSVLMEKGLKVGLYTSPHLSDFRERIRISGEKISEEYVVQFIEKYKMNIEQLNLSFFELTVGMAFDYFAEKQVDIAVIEVGMGGTLDSTNVIHPLLSVITNISFDHTFFLGKTLDKIAGEKAGIIKTNTPVLIGRKQAETTAVFKEKAAQKHADLHFATDIIQCGSSYIDKGLFVIEDVSIKPLSIHIPFLKTPLSGNYQIENIKTALAAIAILYKDFNLESQQILNGFRHVISNTHFRGRWERLSDNPLIICDTGHNLEGVKSVVAQLKSLKKSKIHFVLGVVNDKSLDEILPLFPKEAVYYFCKANIPRGLDANILFSKSQEYGLHGKVYDSVAMAYAAARQNVKDDEMVFIGGSTFTVAEIL